MSSIYEEDEKDTRSMIMKHGVFLLQLLGGVLFVAGIVMFLITPDGKLLQALGIPLAGLGLLGVLLPVIVRGVSRRRGGKISRDFRRRMQYNRIKYKQEFGQEPPSRHHGTGDKPGEKDKSE